MIVEIKSTEEFNKVINQKLVLIDFYTEICGFCKEQDEILKENEKRITSSYPDLRLFKVDCLNIDPSVSKYYGIMHVPTLILFSFKKYKKIESGLHNYDDIRSFLNKSIRNLRLT